MEARKCIEQSIRKQIARTLWIKNSYREEILGVIGDAIGDENDHVLLRSGVSDRFAEDSNAKEELIAVEQRHVRLRFAPLAPRSSKQCQNDRDKP